MSDHATLFAETGLASLVATQGDESRVRYVSAAGVELAVTAIVGQETLEEIGIRARHDFIAAGGESLTLVPSLNSDADWAQAVVKLVRANDTSLHP